MKEKLLKILFVILGILALGNVLTLDYLIFFKKNIVPVGNSQTIKEESATESGQKGVSPLTCVEDCQQLIDQKINEAISQIPTQKPAKSIAYAVPTSSQSPQPKIIYVSVCSDGSSSNKDWANIASCEFYFDLTDYPGAKEVRFVASLKMVNSSAQALARLYDQTNFRAVDYSDLLSSSSEFNRVESSGITIWRGNNKYIVQLKSGDGNEVQLKEAKLKISF